MPSPMGIIDMSTPREKNPTPTISSTAPTRKSISEATGMGATVKLRIRTIPVMGTTEVSASNTFSFSFLFIDASLNIKCIVFRFLF